jgi:metal-sulfur cluster biosynthetic enzyme
MDNQKLRAVILKKMATVIDPETGVDVVRMRLIEDLVVDESGHVAYKFRPSSAFCPIAVPLADAIQKAVAEVPGVTSQDVQIVGFALSEEVTALLKQAIEERFRELREQEGEKPHQK